MTYYIVLVYLVSSMFVYDVGLLLLANAYCSLPIGLAVDLTIGLTVLIYKGVLISNSFYFKKVAGSPDRIRTCKDITIRFIRSEVPFQLDYGAVF